MTATPYPPPQQATSAQPAVPADATGVYPNLVGYAPIELSRRIAVAVADTAIYLAVYLALNLGIVTARSAGFAVVLIAVIGLGFVAASLWALVARSARLAGVFMGARYVDVRTGRPAPGALFLKSLLQSAVSGLTLGIAPLIVVFATIQQPLQRNWFDRVTGLMLVDTRRGRSPDEPHTPPPAATVPPAPPAIAPVHFPDSGSAAPAAPWVPAAKEPSVPASFYDFGASYGAPHGPGHGGISQVADPGGIITSTPGSGSVPAPGSVAPAPDPAPLPTPVVREMRSVDAALADSTILAPDSGIGADADGPQAFLEGTRLSQQPPTVIGRNPLPPGSHPDAVPHLVSDLLASKTHLVLGRDEAGPWVIDLHSTNGVSVAKVPGAEPLRIEPGRKVHLPSGASVRFGGQTIEIR